MNPDEQPADLPLLERALEAIERGDALAARKLLRRAPGPDHPGRAWARWRLLCLDDDLTPALAEAGEAARRWPDEPDLQHALGWTLLALDDPHGAIAPLEEAAYLDPEFADAWYDLGLAREALGDRAGKRLAMTKCWEIESAPPAPTPLFDPDLVFGWAEAAVADLPEPVRAAAVNVPIIVQDYPDAWILEDEPCDPRLLGIFVGLTAAEELSGLAGNEGAMLALARPHVYVFQRNLEASFPRLEDMRREVAITVVHELGHYLGLDEEALHERGLG